MGLGDFAKEHFSLGFGAHSCLGAPLARLEGAHSARGTERTPSQPAPDTGADAAFPAQHHVPRPALAPCRMGHLTTTRSMDGQAGGLHLATFFSWSLHSASARLQPPPSAL